MTAPFDFTYSVDWAREMRELREEAAKQEELDRIVGLLERLEAFSSDTSRQAAVEQAATSVPVKPVSSQPPTGRWRIVKQILRPGLRKKRVTAESAVPPSTPAVNVPQEAPPLPGSSNLMFYEHERRAQRPDPDADLFEDDDLENTEEQQVPELSDAELADLEWERSMAEYDAPGNRYSTRPGLPPEWTAHDPEYRGLGNMSSFEPASDSASDSESDSASVQTVSTGILYTDEVHVRPKTARSEVEEMIASFPLPPQSHHYTDAVDVRPKTASSEVDEMIDETVEAVEYWSGSVGRK